ncbi:mechanosensitive ion channel domain-containing protein [Chitinibacter sp. S2-10]|uniref:mechanosensitive ion channel domain-containing protein n=1 Tax=Chitinibacter sp. S2-10 TaxID=3373597 RepID=UPI0039778098
MLLRWFILLLLSAPALAISLPGIKNPAPASAPASNETATDALAAKTSQVQQRLEQVQQALQQLKNNDPQAYEQQFLLEVQLTAYRQHLAALSGLRTQQSLAQTQAPVGQIASGVLALNARRKLIQISQLDVENLMATLKSQEAKLDELRSEIQQSQAQLRLKSEALERAKPAQQREALAEYTLAKLKVDTNTAVLGAREERNHYTRIQLQNSRERLQALNESIKDAPAHPPVSNAEMAEIRQQLDARQQSLNTQIAQLLEDKQQWQKQQTQLEAERDAAFARVGSSRASEAENTTKPAELDSLLQKERINLLRLDNNAIHIGILLDMLNNQSLEEAFWQIYYNIDQDGSANELSQFQQHSKKWDESLSQSEAQAKQAALVARMSASLITPDSVAKQTEHELWLERARIYTEAENEWSRLRLIINRRSVEFATHSPEKSIEMRADYWQDKVADFIVQVWQYELFSVADTIQIDGKDVSLERGVNVSKVIYAILLITIGFFVTLKLAGALERRLVRTMHWSPVTVRIAKRWLLSVAFIILLMNSLLLVRIPLTVFAFLGGAIAIGLGFGMQTLLKNLISGLMMLLERPFKPGDTVEVGNLRGTVVDMSVRAAVIRDINGIETLVPNSTFLEQNVTNWTYSSSLIRQSVKVGVAYGSDVRQVAELLAAEVKRHGQICPEPEAEILLEDFGADALMFGVYYWIDVNAGTIGRQVASDLRFMIEATLRKHEIEIAFPQRDLHISQPVQIKVERNTSRGI